jgi:imidazole glycerol phosphate synthase subunit HisF
VFHRGLLTIGQVKAALADAGVVVRWTGGSRP